MIAASTKNHNKRRNACLMMEFLVRCMSEALVAGDAKRSATVLKIIKKHFKQGSELHKEYRLASSLLKTSVSSPHVAASIVSEAKAAARSYDVDKLNKEKSILIREVNCKLRDKDFYDRPVTDYRMHATIGTLLNCWRSHSSDVDLSLQARYEDQLVEWLSTERSIVEEQALTDESPGMRRLIMKTMMERVNDRYADALNPVQKDIVRAYAFSAAREDDNRTLRAKLESVKSSLVEEIDTFCQDTSEFMRDKAKSVRERLLAESTEKVDDSVVSRFMLYAKLLDEMGKKDDK